MLISRHLGWMPKKIRQSLLFSIFKLYSKTTGLISSFKASARSSPLEKEHSIRKSQILLLPMEAWYADHPKSCNQFSIDISRFSTSTFSKNTGLISYISLWTVFNIKRASRLKSGFLFIASEFSHRNCQKFHNIHFSRFKKSQLSINIDMVSSINVLIHSLQIVEKSGQQ